MTNQYSHIHEFGPWRLDAAQHLLFHQGAHVPLQPKAFEILLALVERPGEVVSKEELMESVWPDTFIEEINLTKNISVLRKALANGDGTQDYIQTIPKRGYRFVAELSEPQMVAESGEPQTEETSLAQLAPSLPPFTGAVAESTSHRTVRFVQFAWTRPALMAALVVIGVVLSALLYWRPGSGAITICNDPRTTRWRFAAKQEAFRRGMPSCRLSFQTQVPGLGPRRCCRRPRVGPRTQWRCAGCNQYQW